MRFDEDDNGFFGGEDGDIEGDDSLEICAPIQCNEDDDGPDFSRMVKKQATADSAGASSNSNKKGQDIRKRFEIERPRGAPSAIAATGNNLISPAGSSTNSHNTVSTDMSLNNPLAESLTAE